MWSSALRMLRVDFESPIHEKDQESGYFLFDFREGAKQHPGSVELVRATEDGVESVRVVITIAALPSYVEQMLLDRLQRKLVAEFGDPTEPAKPAEDPSKRAPGRGGPGKGGPVTPPTKPKAPAQPNG